MQPMDIRKTALEDVNRKVETRESYTAEMRKLADRIRAIEREQQALQQERQERVGEIMRLITKDQGYADVQGFNDSGRVIALTEDHYEILIETESAPEDDPIEEVKFDDELNEALAKVDAISLEADAVFKSLKAKQQERHDAMSEFWNFFATRRGFKDNKAMTSSGQCWRIRVNKNGSKSLVRVE